jgi:hypothetical protein
MKDTSGTGEILVQIPEIREYLKILIPWAWGFIVFV